VPPGASADIGPYLEFVLRAGTRWRHTVVIVPVAVVELILPQAAFALPGGSL
jgi:hypothetical protein